MIITVSCPALTQGRERGYTKVECLLTRSTWNLNHRSTEIYSFHAPSIDRSAVKIDNKLTQSFTCHAGVKQGCMLSPTVFNFYLSDVPKLLNKQESGSYLMHWHLPYSLLCGDWLQWTIRKGSSRISSE